MSRKLINRLSLAFQVLRVYAMFASEKEQELLAVEGSSPHARGAPYRRTVLC